MSEHHQSLIKVFFAWLMVGVSQFSPLQAVQFIAAIVAIVYSLVQIWAVLRGKK